MKKSYFFASLVVGLGLMGAGCTWATSHNNLETILTKKDFGGLVSSSREVVSAERNETEGTFLVQINPRLPSFIFHVTSFTTTTQGQIEIFRNSTTTKPSQIIALDPNIWVANEVPLFFSVHDINFDGFADIGLAVEGGAKWASYQYWTYDTSTGQFEISPITQEFRKIYFNEIKFDNTNNEIITNNFFGPSMSDKSVYAVVRGHLKLLEEYHQDQGYLGGRPIKQCTITIKKYNGATINKITQVTDGECIGYFGLN